MSACKIILQTNSHAHVVKSIPGDCVCVVSLGGGGITDLSFGMRMSQIVNRELLNSMPDIPNYVVVYDQGMSSPTRIQMQYETHRQNIVTNPPTDQPVNLYINEQNINWVFRHRVAPLITAGHQKLNFIFDGDKTRMKSEITKRISSITAKPQQYIKNIFPFDLYFSEPYMDDLFNAILLPRITDENGNRIPTDVAARRIRKINFRAHCFGAYVALGMEKRMQNKMRELGYCESEMKHIQSQMLVVALNPACPFGVSKSQFFGFMSAYDKQLQRPANWVTEYITNRRNSELNDNKKWDMKRGFLSGKYGNIFFVKKRFALVGHGTNPPIGNDEHNNSHYLYDGMTDDGRFIMQLSRNIIINGIKNSLTMDCDGDAAPLGPIEELILDGENDTKIKREFTKMQKNGNRFMTDVYNFATQQIRENKIAQPAKQNSPNIR
ncbi:MAG: hypothetical protein IJ560_01590 [Alphaproteobacteria bacterium]|nr:hypothetical protein [Alphaproteobacteria bacterium]